MKGMTYYYQCDCGLTNGCDKCRPSQKGKLPQLTIEELVKDALVDAGLFYLENRDGDKDTITELSRIAKDLISNLDQYNVVQIDESVKLPVRTWFPDFGGESGRAGYDLALKDMADYKPVKRLI